MDAAAARFEADMAKTFGEGTLRSGIEPVHYDIIPTGSLALDIATGVGGLVVGRQYEIWGVDNIGKTALSCLIMAQAQRRYPEKWAAVVDVEHTFDQGWAARLGVDPRRLYVYTPHIAEDASDALVHMVRDTNKTGMRFSYIVLDTVAAMIPKKEMDALAEEAVVARQAQIITRLAKKCASLCAENDTTIMYLNQVRSNISAYGAPTQTGGGHALRHHTTAKFQMKRTGTTPYTVKVEHVDGGRKEEIQVGHEVATLVERNKVGRSRATALFSIFFVDSDKYGPVGVDQADEAARVGQDYGAVVRKGAWYHLGEQKFNGFDLLVTHLREHPEKVIEIREQVLASLAGQVTEEPDPETEPVEIDE